MGALSDKVLRLMQKNVKLTAIRRKLATLQAQLEVAQAALLKLDKLYKETQTDYDGIKPILEALSQVETPLKAEIEKIEKKITIIKSRL